MKYIKTFEKVPFSMHNYIDDINIKRDEYTKYIGKYAILEHVNIYYLAKIISLDYSKYYFNIETYEYDEEYKGYNVFPENFHIINFNILKAFDTFAEAKKDFEILQDSNKYNL